MKRVCGILLVTVYMLSFAELHNLLRIPVLFSHFQEHQQRDPNTNFWGFIRDHYTGPIVVGDDFDRDQQLPFRGGECCVVVLNYSCECPQMEYEILLPGESVSEFSLYRERNKRLEAADDFFQPPRCA